MTETEWLTGTNPFPMLEHVRETIRVGRAQGRKDYLLAVASCRLIWHLIPDERLRRGVQWAEEFADDVDKPDQWVTIRDGVNAAFNSRSAARGESEPRQEGELWAITDVVGCLVRKGPQAATAGAFVVCKKPIENNPVGSALIRDVFGNPFRLIALDRSWLTSTVLALARGIYAEKAFDRMPILADALQDAGCENEDVLNHCRGESVHVRGCFVIDLLLGKG